MTDLLALAERVEAAEAAVREIDGAIDRLLHDRPKHGDYEAAENALWQVKDGWSGLLVRGDGYARGSFSALRYTASLDAAMTLIDGECFWRVGNDGEGPDPSYFRADVLWFIWPNGKGASPHQRRAKSVAATPALALTAASLRARHHLTEQANTLTREGSGE